jgi:hypothetical protein
VSSLAQNAPQKEINEPDWKVEKVGAQRQGKKPSPNSSLILERVIEDQIPSHIPLNVELLNLKKEDFLRKLEIKITNTSNKPIYYLRLSLLLPDVLSPNGNPISFPIKYGRTDLMSFQEPIRLSDVPILPRQSFVFKIREENLGPFERYATRKNFPLSEIKRAYLIFHLLNFGDKTGYTNTGGSPVSAIPNG